jgi:glycolate oxidase iron-sulfur subunit
MDKCVHCGFCLAACPSYLLLGTEADSPRGRVALMKAAVNGRVEMGRSVAAHFDSCLGCFACETACPSGVRYAPLLEEMRAATDDDDRRPFTERAWRFALFRILPFPGRLRVLMPLIRLADRVRRWPVLLATLPPALRVAVQLAPRGRSSAEHRPLSTHTPAAGAPRRRVGLLRGCVQEVFFDHVNEASARVLAAEGCEVLAPGAQSCCGALAFHAGRLHDARAHARRLIAQFEGVDVDEIAVNAAGCGSTMKGYEALFRDDPAWAARARAFAAKVRDITEMLASLAPSRAGRHRLDLRVAYHDACHLAHAQGVRSQPRELLRSVPGVVVVPLAESDICCGSAGIFNLVQPEMAAALGRRKAAHIAASSADVVVTCNPGCMLQIDAAQRAAGESRPVMHLVELLDASIRGTRPA